MILKKLSVCASAAVMMFFTSCTLPPESVSKKDNQKKIETAMELIKNQNSDELILLFSSEMQEHHKNALLKEFDQMYSYLDGDIVAYDKPKSCGYSQKTVDHGDIRLYVSSPIVKNVNTEGGQSLTFLFTYTVIDDENPEKVGLEQILIFTQEENGDLCEMQLNINGDLNK